MNSNLKSSGPGGIRTLTPAVRSRGHYPDYATGPLISRNRGLFIVLYVDDFFLGCRSGNNSHTRTWNIKMFCNLLQEFPVRSALHGLRFYADDNILSRNFHEIFVKFYRDLVPDEKHRLRCDPVDESREGDRLPYVLELACPHDYALDSQSEPSMRYASPLPHVQVPVVRLRV